MKMSGFAAFLRLYRRRMWWAFAVAMAIVQLGFYFIGTHFANLSVYWHGACNCRVSSSDPLALLEVTVAASFYVGVTIGFPTGVTVANRGDTRFLMTRPVSRTRLLWLPFAIAATAVAVLPLVSILLLLGWLSLVGAPVVGHVKALLELVPSAAMLGQGASLWTIAAATHFWWFYAAGISLGLCSYALIASQRWLVLSEHNWLKILGGLTPLILWLPAYLVRNRWFREVALMVPARGNPNGSPSALAIGLHVIFAGAVVFECWRLARVAEA
jgi:hypothetical protein